MAKVAQVEIVLKSTVAWVSLKSRNQTLQGGVLSAKIGEVTGGEGEPDFTLLQNLSLAFIQLLSNMSRRKRVIYYGQIKNILHASLFVATSNPGMLVFSSHTSVSHCNDRSLKYSPIRRISWKDGHLAMLPSEKYVLLKNACLCTLEWMW